MKYSSPFTMNINDIIYNWCNNLAYFSNCLMVRSCWLGDNLIDNIQTKLMKWAELRKTYIAGKL